MDGLTNGLTDWDWWVDRWINGYKMNEWMSRFD